MSDEKYPWDLWRAHLNTQQGRTAKSRAVNHVDTEKLHRRIRYGAGMVIGFLTVRFIKKRLCSVPVLGAVLSPLLGLVPTLIVGPAIGAAAVYGYDKGDPLAAVPLVTDTWQDVQKQALEAKERVEVKLRKTVEDTSSTAQKDLAPYMRELETQFKRAVHEVDLTAFAKEIDKSVKELNPERLLPADFSLVQLPADARR